MTNIGDVGDLSFGEREHIFLRQLGKTGASPDLTQHDLNYVKERATEEMLDEIHIMLRVICTKLGIRDFGTQ